jgi:hypothetical protein
MNWRQLIHQYLSGCAEDDRNRLIVERTNRRQHFIEQCGTERLKQSENARIQSNILTSQEPPGSPDSYVVVEEQDDYLIVEVEPAENGHPFKLTRFRLIQTHGKWKLDDYLWQCQCSNGKCNWCDGSGICAVCQGDGECRFCDGQHICQLCKGIRICSICKDSDMPGWNSMTNKSNAV